jgi:hypothetical protein
VRRFEIIAGVEESSRAAADKLPALITRAKIS